MIRKEAKNQAGACQIFLGKIGRRRRAATTGVKLKIRYDVGSVMSYMLDVERKEKNAGNVKRNDILLRCCKGARASTMKERSVDYIKDDFSTINVVRRNRECISTWK